MHPKEELSVVGLKGQEQPLLKSLCVLYCVSEVRKCLDYGRARQSKNSRNREKQQ
jgi:hypothetical protein